MSPELELRAQKLFIQMAASVEEADKLIEEYTPYRTTLEKLAWLYENFDVRIIDRTDKEDDKHDDYVCLLSAIIKY